jgi:hypothetical protein
MGKCMANKNVKGGHLSLRKISTPFTNYYFFPVLICGDTPGSV